MKKVWVLMIIMMIISVVPIFADTGNADSAPWDSGLTKFMNALTGNTARIIGVIMIVGAGIAVAVTEGQAIKKLLWVVGGMGIALNAVSFARTLFGIGSGMLVP